MKQFVTKYHYFNESTDLSKIIKEKWFCFRKYNGNQGVWDGGITRGKQLNEIPFACPSDDPLKVSTGLWSTGRDGYPHIINAPYQWLNKLPKNMPICGELWNEQDDEYLLSKQMSGTKWEDIRFVMFNIKPYFFWGDDLNLAKLGFYKNLKYRETYKYLQKLPNNGILKVPHIFKIKNKEHWEHLKALATEAKYEGYVFINPHSFYELGTSGNILKWKQEFETEVFVEGYTPGKKEEIGAVKVRFKWGENLRTIKGADTIPEYILGRLVKGKEIVYPVSLGIKKEDRTKERIKVAFPLNKEFKIRFNGVTNTGIPKHGRFIND